MSLFPLCTRVMLRTLLAMLLAIAATVAGVGWHELQTARQGQRPHLLGLAYAGAGAARNLLDGGKATPGHSGKPVEEQLRDQLAAVTGLDENQQASTVVEVVRCVPE